MLLKITNFMQPWLFILARANLSPLKFRSRIAAVLSLAGRKDLRDGLMLKDRALV
jgi:hypothetical protein